jgi:hypothetical protein
MLESIDTQSEIVPCETAPSVLRQVGTRNGDKLQRPAVGSDNKIRRRHRNHLERTEGGKRR